MKFEFLASKKKSSSEDKVNIFEAIVFCFSFRRSWVKVATSDASNGDVLTLEQL